METASDVTVLTIWPAATLRCAVLVGFTAQGKQSSLAELSSAAWMLPPRWTRHARAAASSVTAPVVLGWFGEIAGHGSEASLR